ncbi:MAG: hypothetical protein AB7E79_11355 [Rhodospirillaceae bacterium]
MIIHLNGWPGVGKASIARELAPVLSGRVLEHHTIGNVAYSLTIRKTPEFYDTYRAVRKVAFDRIMTLDRTVPVILTNCLASGSEAGRETWDAVVGLGRTRGCLIYFVTLTCEPEEHRRRMTVPVRATQHKLVDPDEIDYQRLKELITPPSSKPHLTLDTTHLAPAAAANEISTWVGSTSSDLHTAVEDFSLYEPTASFMRPGRFMMPAQKSACPPRDAPSWTHTVLVNDPDYRDVVKFLQDAAATPAAFDAAFAKVAAAHRNSAEYSAFRGATLRTRDIPLSNMRSAADFEGNYWSVVACPIEKACYSFGARRDAGGLSIKKD